jgi:sigma-B regulation protein RsbU (phosphoserine phosphatase)
MGAREGKAAAISLIEPNADTLQWAEERLRLAVEAARLGPWEWDIVVGKVYWTPALEALHGIPIGSFDGSFDSWKRDIHPDDLDRVLATVGEGLEKRTGHNMEYRIIQPNGSVRWLEVRSRLQCDEEGRPVRMMGICMDVTERKQIEEARDLFIGILGHDLRNPLQAIQMAASLLLRNNAQSAEVLKPAAAVARSADRMDRIISDLLDFARGRFGQGIPVTPAPMSMEAVCRRVVEESSLANPNRQVSLEVDGPTTGHWDPERIAQVVSNLVGNAITHGTGAVRVSLTAQADSVRLVVSNRGEPIAAEALPLLFQPFFSRTGDRKGLGLGLFIASEIVKAHQGRIEVASSHREGTTFTVSLLKLP